jgi:hypothetical protein
MATKLFEAWERLDQWEKTIVVFSFILLPMVLFSKCHGEVAILN